LTEEPVAEVVVSVRASLDVPGETRRQALVLVIWMVCLGIAVAVGSMVGTHIPAEVVDPDAQEHELDRSKLARAEVALLLGLILPIVSTWYVTHRRRRGGPHARGIRIEVTRRGELRLWGRGYGSRVELAGARVEERLIDMYAGRLGAWRERRLSVSTGGRVVAVGTPAAEEDADLPRQGGEGDCVELERADYLRLRTAIVERC
jgi:hypothetical protein